jgi:site-specific recombinase XerD
VARPEQIALTADGEINVITSHVLRHTFCSHLAMRGAAPKAIQELVGHSTLTMTLRYMHLAPSALCEAIDMLTFGQPVGTTETNEADC